MHWKRILVGGAGAVLVIWVLFPPTVRSVAIRFHWERAKGFRSIAVESPPLDPISRYIIALQAKSSIRSEFEKAGWTSGGGVVNVVVHYRFLVGGIDHRDGWNVEVIDPEVTPLMQASENGDLSKVNELIAAGAKVDAQDQRGWTALVHASMKGQLDAVNNLLRAGAVPDLRDREGRTALFWAAWNCRIEVVRALIIAGADPSAKDNHGGSLLSRAPTQCVDSIQRAVTSAQRSKTTSLKRAV